MSWTSGFFNSVNNDRVYNADQISDIFKGVITDGVFYSVGNKLAVQPNSGLTIQIADGRGWFGGRWVNNEAECLLTLEAADVTLNRYCAVCVRTNLNDSAREAKPYLKYGEFATNPVKPTMERTDKVKEYCLAYIYIKAKATEITAADIEDTRANTELCGWVTGVIKQLDSTTLFAQFEQLFTDFMYESEEDFKAWFEDLEALLEGDVAANLAAAVASLQSKAPIKLTATFDGLGWDSQSDGTYIQTLNVPGVAADSDIVVKPRADYAERYKTMGICPIEQGDGFITFSSRNPDDINAVVEIIIINW